MDYDDPLLAQVVALLQREQRLSPLLKQRLPLDNEMLEDLTEDLISFRQLQRGGLGQHQSCLGDTAEEWRWA